MALLAGNINIGPAPSAGAKESILSCMCMSVHVRQAFQNTRHFGKTPSSRGLISLKATVSLKVMNGIVFLFFNLLKGET